MKSINNFRFIYGEPKKEKSLFLIPYKNILGYKVYKVTMNDLAFVVFDEENNDYYNFERTITKRDTIDTDLEYNIKLYVSKTL